MNQINSLPNKQEVLIKLRIMEDLLTTTTENKSVLAISIRTAIYNKTSCKELFNFIKDSAKDNFSMVVATIGEELLCDIISI